MIPKGTIGGARADMHCHSTASEVAKLGIQKSIGLPECATPPEEVYELAKRRGMDFVTITDHDTIDGCLEIADRPDTFISEELTTWFAGEPQAVHVLCYGITPNDHEFLQAHASDLETCAAYLHEHEITCALAHPFFAVAAPLTGRHRRRLAQLFGVWETRNGSRARELNMPAWVYIETHGGTGIGGSDDHAGVDIGRTFTETAPASTPEQFLAHIRAGEATSRGDQGSAAKWAHSALALATRTLMAKGVVDPVGTENSVAVPSGTATGMSNDVGAEEPTGSDSNGRVDPSAVLEIAERVVADGGERGGEAAPGLGAKEARALLRAWLDSIDLNADPKQLVELMQADDFSHSDLARRARRIHERRLREAVDLLTVAADAGEGFGEAARSLFEACIPAIPYVPSTTILGNEKAKLSAREGEPGRVALVVDGAGSMHGVTHTIERIREHGVPGWEVEVVGTDPRVDRRLPAVAEVEVPFYPGMTIGIPSVPELVATLAEGRYDLVHLASPGPAGVGAALTARIGGIPLCGSYHTELAAYAGLRSGDASLEAGMRLAIAVFYRQCEVVLSPSRASDESLIGLGIDPERIGRWVRGVDLGLYDPRKRDRDAYPGEIKVLYAGRLTREKGAELLAESFLRARERDPRLHLLLAGGGPEEALLRERLGEHATFLGWLDRDELARAYASADVFLFCSRTDTYGQVIAEAQASGLPVVAVAEGGPLSLIRDRQTGWLCEPDPSELAAAVAQLAASPFLRDRVARAALADVQGRTWEAALAQLAAGYERSLSRARSKPEPTPLMEVA
jgi:glycosyltransferase involved in cell wall biosynthesis/predicted metal-dependent phosphoesterase TrpH